MYIRSITKYIMTCTLIYQVKLINTAIDNAKGSSRLRGLQHVGDPSAEVVDALIQCTGISPLASLGFQRQSSQSCTTRLLRFSTSCSETCLTRQGKSV